MDFKLRFHPKAKEEWFTVIDFYDEKKEGLGFEVFQEIENYLEILKEKPLHFQKRFGNTRVLFTKRFHFGIHYIVQEELKEIYIISILNARDNLLKISNRIL